MSLFTTNLPKFPVAPKCVYGNTLEMKGLQSAVDRLVILAVVYRTVRAVC